MGGERGQVTMMDPSPYYKLIDGEVVRCDDVMDWTHWWLTTEDRFVARTAHGPLEVATSFTGLDHGFPFGATGLFVTNILGVENGGYDRFEWLSDTLEEAQRQHDRVVAFLNGEIKLEDVGSE